MNTTRHGVRARILALILVGLPAFALAQAPVALRLDADELARLKSLSPEATVQATLRDAGALAAKDAGKNWTFRRIEVYADDAQLWIARATGLEPAPRSPLIHYIGTRPGERIALSLMPDGKQGEGLLVSGEGAYRLDVATSRRGLSLVGTSTDAPLPDGSLPESDCLGGMHGPESLGKTLGLADATEDSSAHPKAATRRVTLALDTDNELLQLKFSDNTAAASNYLAALVTGMSAIYSLDPGAGGARLQLQIGHQILRPSTGGADPYPSTSDTPINDQLNEFGAYWMGNHGGISRAFSLMISGKHSNNYGAAGIAWVLSSGSYCAATGTNWGGQTAGHYSVSRVFKFAGATAANDVSLVAHELGHNFGLDHTHCTMSGGNYLDQCFSGEGSGCYSGPVSCPIGSPGAPKGTLMSYCHVSSASCGPNVQLFHPVHVTTLNSRIASQPPSCVVPLGSPNQPPTITAPASFTVTEDVASPLNGISFADPDAGSGSLTATFSVPSGSLTTTGAAGVVVGGTATSRTLQGTLAALNSFLSSGHLRYTTAPNATANVNLTIQINDNGHSGSGGANTASVTRTITVTPVNDAPTLSVPGFLPLFASGTAPVSGVVFNDVDAGSASVTVALTAPAGVTLSSSTCAGVTASGSSVRTFNDTLANLNACFAAGHVRMSGPGFVGPANLQIAISDNGHTGSGGAKSASANVPLRGGILFANGFE